MTYCSNCGTALRDGEKFCHECGARVEQPTVSQGDAATQPLVTPQQPVGMPYGAPPIPPQQPVGVPPTPPQPPMGTPYGASPQQMAQPMPQQKKDGKRIALKVFLAFLPLIIGVGGYSLWYNLGKKATESALTPTSKQQAKQTSTEGDLVIEETTSKQKKVSETTAKDKETSGSTNDPKSIQIDVRLCTPTPATSSGKSTIQGKAPARTAVRQQGEPMGMTDEEYEATYGRRPGTPSISSQQRQQRQTTQQQTRRRRSAEEIVGSFGPNTDESARARVRQLKAQGRITAEEYNDCIRYIDRRRHAGQ